MAFARAHRDHKLPPSSLSVARKKVPVREPSLARRALRIAGKTLKAFLDDNVTRLGAALAFYTTIAVAPLMVIAIMLAAYFFDEGARDQVIGQVQSLAGRRAGEALSALQGPAAADAAGTATTGLSVVMLVFGGFGVFYHLQEALNSIWRVKLPPTKGWRMFLKQRLFSLATVLATGFLLMVSLIASAMLSWVGSQTISHFGLPVLALQITTNALSFVVVTCLFAMIFKLLPDAPVQWRHVWLGAVVTAVLFTAGKGVLGWYLGRASVTSPYGAAGSLVVLLLWCFYAAQIVFLGVEFTRVTALSSGGRDFTPLTKDEKRTV